MWVRIHFKNFPPFFPLLHFSTWSKTWIHTIVIRFCTAFLHDQAEAIHFFEWLAQHLSHV
jgi:hypothetical protein